ncbi:acyl-CoA dehydrogenase family protein [Streptomyces sp. ACT015]|uniref:acyl-CoA dehydrogenase family protein n=1 Tax=Streptomyces sp. ACT015 TaxID=3134807 RepID=UPI003D17A5B2
MPAFSLEPAQNLWRAELRALAADRLRPLAERGEPGRVNRPLLAELGRLGLLGRLFTSGALDLCLMRESLGYACTEAETALALQGLGAHPVHTHGTPEQRSRWLPGVIDGTTVAAFALSEPGAGSDAAALELRAEEREPEAAKHEPPQPPEPCPGTADAAPRAGEGTSGAAARDPLPGGVDVELRVGEGASGAAAREPLPGGADVELRAVAGESAERTSDADRTGWRLTGTKCWISNAPEADFYTVFARTGPGAGARGVTAFLVPADRPGLTGERLDMLSPHPIGTLDFDAVPVTRDDVLGHVGGGFRVAMATLDLFRPSVGAFAVGMAQAAVDATLAHTAERGAFGGTLSDLQTVAHQVAEMSLRTEAARLMVYAAATAYDERAADLPGRVAMAKLLATETAQYVVDHAVQLHGARALRRGHLLEHLYREVRAPRIYEGASEVQRGIIARELYRNVTEKPCGSGEASAKGAGK